MEDTDTRIKHWRAQAEELRALSERFTVPTARATLLELAQRFEEAAQHLEQRDIRSL
jgi:sirohydrochlorin ferrochelatase